MSLTKRNSNFVMKVNIRKNEAVCLLSNLSVAKIIMESSDEGTMAYELSEAGL